jgi:hypothetical protein
MNDERPWTDEFIDLISDDQPANINIEKAFALKNRNLPKRLFKFRRDSKEARDNLINNTVWLSSPETFNDPYDCSLTVQFDHVVTTVLGNSLDDFVAKYGPQKFVSELDLEVAKRAKDPHLALADLIITKVEPGTTQQDAQAMRFLRSLAPDYKQKMANEIGQRHKKGLKVCSFTEVNDSIIMWSHYGDEHRGFCVEYDLAFPAPENLSRRLLFPVIYSSQLFDATKYFTRAALNPTGFNNIFPLIAAIYKSPEWKYEKEWRLVSIGGLVKDSSNWNMLPAKRLFLGSHMPPTKRDELVKIARTKKIEVFQMRLANDSFTLISDQIA